MDLKSQEEEGQCPSAPAWFARDTPERMLLREGIIDRIGPSLCLYGRDRLGRPRVGGKNVILVIGDVRISFVAWKLWSD